MSAPVPLSQSVEQEEKLDEEEEVQNIIALCYSHNQLGIAGYRELYNTIYGDAFDVGLEDIEPILLSIKLTFEPTFFLLHPAIITNTSLLKAILEGIDGRANFYRYKTLRTAAWNEKTTASLIYNDLKIRARSTGQGTVAESVFETVRRLEIDMDIEKIRLKQSLGALLTYLQDHVFNLDQGRIFISAIERFPNISYMRLDDNSYKALQIFHEDYHPNWIANYGKSKEGFSLYGLYDRTHSILGKQKLREWMSKPFCDIARITERQEGIKFYLRETNRELLSQLKFNLRHISDIPKLIVRIKKVTAKPKDWCKLYTSISNAATIVDKLEVHKSYLSIQSEDWLFLDKIFKYVNTYVLRNLVKILSTVIEFHQTLDLGEIVIQEGIDPVLDEKKEAYANLDQILTEAGQVILEESPFLEKFNVDYIPQVGYLLVLDNPSVQTLHLKGFIKNEEDMNTKKIIADPFTPVTEASSDNGLIWIFSQNDKSYFKNRIMRGLDQSLGDLKTDIAIRQRAILINLEDQLLDFEIELLQTAVAIATLDAYMSLGEIAFQNKLVCPQITAESVIVIKNGRHILQELTVDSYIPNDTYITGDKCVSIITGPNGSGKSIYIKQVGLIVYMAHIGSFVPCERAIIGLTDKIFTRIFTEESATDCHSSFTSDITQVSRMLNHHTPKTLCLLDEFGKGTDPLDGMALLASVVKYFADCHVKSIFSVHYTEILNDRLLPHHLSQAMSCFRMETINDSISNDEEPALYEEIRVIPLYKLRYGIEHEAYGIECAESMGVLPMVIKRAREIKFCLQNKVPIEPFDTAADHSENSFFTESERELVGKLIIQECEERTREDGNTTKVIEFEF